MGSRRSDCRSRWPVSRAASSPPTLVLRRRSALAAAALYGMIGAFVGPRSGLGARCSRGDRCAAPSRQALATGRGRPRPDATIGRSAGRRNEHQIVGTVVDDPRPREDRIQRSWATWWCRSDGAPVRLGRSAAGLDARGIDAAAGDRMRLATARGAGGGLRRLRVPRGPRSDRVSAASAGHGGRGRRGAAAARALLGSPRGALLEGLNGVVPEPEAALGAGSCSASRASIAPEMNEYALRGARPQAGIVAISGWNISPRSSPRGVAPAAGRLEQRPAGVRRGAIVATTTVAAALRR